MPIDVGSFSPNASQLVQAGAMQAGGGQLNQTGTLLGEQCAVMVEGGVDLSDAAEELSLHMAEKTEQKHHSERKIEDDVRPQLFSLDDLDEMLNDTHDPAAREKLAELVRDLLSGRGRARQQARDAFSAVSQQYLGLQYALQEGERQGADPDLLDDLRDALADLELESGPEIHADLNSLRSAGDFADQPGGVRAFQNTYRDLVLGESSLSGTLQAALTRFGQDDVVRALDHLVTALGHDLAAQRPSAEPARLQALVGDLYHLQVATTVLDGCRELATNLEQRFATPIQASALMRDLVALTDEKWVSGPRFASLCSGHNVISPESRVAFLSDVRRMLKDLPLQVFPDADARHALLSANQDALDAAIDEEDA